MDFGSIRRKNRVSQPSRRKTFSTSNLSCISCSSASVGRKTLYVTLPRDFGCEVNLDGRVIHVVKGGPSHAIGIIQIGDYLRIVEDEDTKNNDRDNVVKLQVTYGVLQVDTRPNCPLVIEIGNRSNTSLGIALTDCADNKIRVSSTQPGSLADRCGFVQPGDILTSVHINSNETIPCSPYYTSYQIAQILRQLTTKNHSISLTILPCCEDKEFPSSSEDNRSSGGGSDSTLTLVDRDANLLNFFPNNFDNTISRRHTNNSSNNTTTEDHRKSIEEEDEDESNACVLSMCLWKDRLYEDWGFSLVDQSDGESESEEQLENKKILVARVNQNISRRRRGAIVYQIRPGGPAFVAGLRPGDRILQINDRDVSQLESTMLVPILASLDDALNLMISRIPNNSNTVN